MSNSKSKITDQNWPAMLLHAVDHFINTAHITREEYLLELKDQSEQASNIYLDEVISNYYGSHHPLLENNLKEKKQENLTVISN